MSRFDVNAASVSLHSMDELSDQTTSQQITSILEKHGFCIVEGWNTSPEIALEVGLLFGYIQKQAWGNSPLYVDVKPSEKNTQKYSVDHSGGLLRINNNDEFLPHTDGTFLRGGFAKKGQKGIEILPPKIIILQCVQAAQSGGESYVVDTKKIIEDMHKNDPSLLIELSRKNFASFHLGFQAGPISVFHRHSEGIDVCFRAEAMVASGLSLEALKAAEKKYFANEKYRISFPLQKNQMLVVDNLRMLHGRKPFTDRVNEEADNARHLRRVWIWNDRSRVFQGLRNVNDWQRFDVFTKLLPEESLSPNKDYKNVKTGVRLAETEDQSGVLISLERRKEAR